MRSRPNVVWTVRPRYGRRARLVVAALTAFVAIGALSGAIGLAAHFLPVGATMTSRLPWDSTVLAGCALALWVALPMALASVWVLLRRGGADLVVCGAGVLLVAWIVVELSIVRIFSWLQPSYALIGLVIAFVGYRSAQMRWGATETELDSEFPGDREVPGAQFCATRAVVIAAAPDQIWPWLVQVGRSRAGFYSYDRLDNGGKPSATEILSRFQEIHAGDLAAPMLPVVDEFTSFRVHWIDRAKQLLWSKPDSTWFWQLTELPDGRTRLVTRLRVRYEWSEPAWAFGSMMLIEIADFPMMRKMLLGIRSRAEALNRHTQFSDRG